MKEWIKMIMKVGEVYTCEKIDTLCPNHIDEHKMVPMKLIGEVLSEDGLSVNRIFRCEKCSATLVIISSWFSITSKDD